MLINQVPTEKVDNASSEEELLTIENEYWASKAQALERLEKNEDFKSVVLEGYFKDKIDAKNNFTQQ